MQGGNVYAAKICACTDSVGSSMSWSSGTSHLVDLLNGSLCALVLLNSHKPEAAGTLRLPIQRDERILHRPILAEKLCKVFTLSVPANVADVCKSTGGPPNQCNCQGVPYKNYANLGSAYIKKGLEKYSPSKAAYQ